MNGIGQEAEKWVLLAEKVASVLYLIILAKTSPVLSLLQIVCEKTSLENKSQEGREPGGYLSSSHCLKSLEVGLRLAGKTLIRRQGLDLWPAEGAGSGEQQQVKVCTLGCTQL